MCWLNQNINQLNTLIYCSIDPCVISNRGHDYMIIIFKIIQDFYFEIISPYMKQPFQIFINNKLLKYNKI
ncbi:hypothetical protein pb186bvf_013530 [Paramecium bursaria]